MAAHGELRTVELHVAALADLARVEASVSMDATFGKLGATLRVVASLAHVECVRLQVGVLTLRGELHLALLVGSSYLADLLGLRGQ